MSRWKNKRRRQVQPPKPADLSNKELVAMIEEFRDKFGRDPGPNDPIFFDPSSDTPVALTEDRVHELFEAWLDQAEKSGVDPRMIYAARKCGFIVDENNYRELSEEKIDEWLAACDEYDLMVKDGVHRREVKS